MGQSPNSVSMLGKRPIQLTALKQQWAATLAHHSVADPECARGGGVSHILAEKGLLASLYSKKMHKNAVFSPIREGAYAGYALC